jgi:hypothetical protein
MKMTEQQNRVRRTVVFATSLSTIFALSGCGAPVLPDMKPTVPKLAAEVILVGRPVGWSEQKVAAAEEGMNSGNGNSVDYEVLQLQPSELTSALEKFGQTSPGGLAVLVPSEPDVARVLSVNAPTDIKMTVVASALPPSLPNSWQAVVPSRLEISYALGYLSAILAQEDGTRAVGLFGVHSPSVQRSEVEAALAGIYAVNPNLAAAPIHISASVGVASAPRTTVGNTYVPSSVASTPIYSNTAQVVLSFTSVARYRHSFETSGSRIFSMSDSRLAAPVVAVPGTPSPEALNVVFSEYAAGKWQPGMRTVHSQSLLRFLSGSLPASLLAESHAVEDSLRNGTVDPRSAWTNLPSAVRTLWSSRVFGTS